MKQGKYFRPDGDLESCTVYDMVKMKVLHKLVSLLKYPYAVSSPRVTEVAQAYLAHKHGLAYDFFLRHSETIKKLPGKLRERIGSIRLPGR